MAVIFADDFETGNFVNWTYEDGAPVVQTAITHTGTYAMQAIAELDAANKNIAGQTTLFSRFYFLYDTDIPLGVADEFFGTIQLFGAGGQIIDLYVDRTPANVVCLSFDYIGGQVRWNFPYAINQWYCIEIKVVIALLGEYRVYADGVEVITVTGVDSTANGNINRIKLGQFDSSVGYAPNVYFDDFIAANEYNGLLPQNRLLLNVGL